MLNDIIGFISLDLPILSGDAAVFLVSLHFLAYILVQPGK